MTPRLVACTKCNTALPPVLYNTGALRLCPSCHARLQIEVFPAVLRPPGPGSVGETVAMDGEATCFFHATKRAVVPCGSCGRFLCAVCDVEMNGEHLCSMCIASGRKKGRMQQLESKRTLYDNLALAIALIPMLIVWPTIITAPIVLYLAIRYWNAPSSVVPRSRWRLVLAIILALLQIGGWVAVFIGVFSSKSHH
ncbi:MAG: hypothetical protein P4L99_04795 [Chthoniobacter sp.]|nr:hypothetical protein [Chthoniobacter sp.]